MKKSSTLIILITIFTTLSLYSQTYNSTDLNALLAIDAACDGSNQLNWNTEADPGLWTGITWDNSMPKRVYYLWIKSMSLTGTLDVTELTNMTSLQCQSNKLTGLNISGLTNLHGLECYSNQLTNLNVSSLVNLTALSCSQNQLPDLDVSGLTQLQMLDCSQNQIPNLNLSGMVNLNTLNCDGNQLTSLDLSGLTSLTQMDCSYNQLTTLDLSVIPQLTWLQCVHNQLTNLNISGLTQMRILACWRNNIPALDLSGMTKLESLECAYNQLTSLNMSGLINLQQFYCKHNQLSSLDLSGLVRLEAVDCSANQISSLNISGLSTLKYLDCSANRLSNLNVSDLTSLQYLNCFTNQLSNFDLSALTQLIALSCDTNRLPFSSLKTGLQAATYDYTPQDTIFLPNKSFTSNVTIDYSSEAMINGNATTFVFYKDELAAETNNTGIFTTNGSGVYLCKMTNPLFPGLTLVTATNTVNIVLSLLTTPEIVEMNPEPGTETFDITSNTSWTIYSHNTWLSLSSLAGSNNGTITVSTGVNLTGEDRIDTIIIAGAGVISDTVFVLQYAPDPPVITNVTYTSPTRCGELGIITYSLTGAAEGDVYDVEYTGNGIYDKRDTVRNNTLVIAGVPIGTLVKTSALSNIYNKVIALTVQGGQIQGPPLPLVSLTIPGTFCQNAVQLQGGMPSGGQYSIDGSVMTQNNSQSLSAGTHQMIYSYTDANNCSSSDTSSFVINPNPTSPIYGDQNLCPGTLYSDYSTDNNSQYSYAWYVTGGTYATGAQPSTITVAWTDTIGTVQLVTTNTITLCTDTSIITIRMFDTETPVILNCLSEYHVEAQYSPDGLFYILSDADRGLIPIATDNCPANALIYTFNYNESDYHELPEFAGFKITGNDINLMKWTITDRSRNFTTCSTTIYLEVNRTVPTAFSPNSDLMNDEWNIKFLKQYPACIVKVFNRWGMAVYQSEKGYPLSWDGKRSGQLVPVDTYYYIIDMGDGTVPLKGYVTVLY
jgi:gliding motility-associated-like protein